MIRRLPRSGWALLRLCARLALLHAGALHGQTGLTAPWTPLGPGAVLSPSYGTVTGRITAIALDPNDATGNTVYLGTTGGGVWKSTNAAGAAGSVRFFPMTDTLPVFAATANGGSAPSLSIGALAAQPTANGVVLAGTGDPNNATDSMYGEGLLRSADGGLTWALIAGSDDGVNGKHSFAGLATAALAWSSTSSSLVVAAMTNSPQAAVVGAANSQSVAGLYYSTDAGVTWRMSTIDDGSQVVQQPLLSAQPGNPATSVVWDAARASFFAFVRFHGAYASADGANWTRLNTQPGAGLTVASCPANAGGSGSPSCPLFRGTLAVQPVTGDLYALGVDANNGDQGLWQDLCNANANGVCASKSPVWAARVDGGALDAGSGSTAAVPLGSYTLALSASAFNGGTLLLGGTQNVFRCMFTAGSPSACTWRNTTNAASACATPAGVAPAQHALMAASLTNGGSLVLIGNDGGLWRSLDGLAETGSACAAADASHFDNLNPAIASGGSLAEVAGFAQHPTDANTLLAGLGANGTAAASTVATVWPQISSGEGGLPLLDPGATTNWFATIGPGVDLKLCAKGSGCAAADFAAPATIGAAQVGDDLALLHAPVLLDPALTSNLVLGTCRVWRGRAADATLWTGANAISAAFDGGSAPCTAGSAFVRSVGAGGPVAASANLQSSGSAVVYAGMAGTLDGGGAKTGGHVFVTKSANTANATTMWTDIALSPVTNVLGGVFNPGGYDVSAVTVDPHDATGATVYAAIMGFGGDSAVPHLYRSTDFGAHWMTVSANLPDAPANAVVVDPNDANTVYVATDAGVYATKAIETCATASCWSVLGTGLPNAPAVALQAAANLPTGDGRTGMLRAGTYGRGMWQQPLLTAVGSAQPAITLSATSLRFASQQVGTESTVQTVTVTSSGTAPAVFGSPRISGDFIETDTCAGQTIAAGSSCTVSVRFAPSASGTRTGLLTIYASVSGGQATVPLTGTGTAPAAVVLTPPSLSFAATTVNATTAAQIVTVANTGGTALTIASIAASGDFGIAANTCSSTLASQTACSVSVACTPTASGTRVGALTVVDGAGTQTAALTGTGQAPATDTLTPATLLFAQQAIGTSSTAQLVTLTNAGDQALPLLSTAVRGDFTAVNGCGATLAAHASCAVSVQFVPTATGTRTGVLTVSDAFRSQTIALTGIGVAPAGVSLTPAAVSFGSMGVGLVASAQTVTLTNNGGLPLHLSGVAVSGGFALAANTCGAALPVGAACTLQVVFAPAGAGVISGTLVLTDDALPHTQTVTLSGTGVDFTLAPAGAATLTVSSGTTATYPLLLSSLPTLSGNVALACEGAPAHSVCTVSPGIASLGGAVDASVTVQTGVAHALLQQPSTLRPWERGAVVLALMLLPCALWRRRRALAGAMLLLLLIAVGCSAGRIIPGDGSSDPATPTPAGTYTLTVSATSAGVTHTVPLTLVVQ